VILAIRLLGVAEQTQDPGLARLVEKQAAPLAPGAVPGQNRLSPLPQRGQKSVAVAATAINASEG